MQNIQNVTKYSFMEQERPVLKAELRGSKEFPGLHGEVYVYTLPDGIYLQGDVEGLPKSSDFAFHVHEGLVCEELGGKLLVLPDVSSDADGKASAQVYLDRANSTQIAGKPIVLHLKTDGKETQIACGLLSRIL
ncbi:MAG: superoxide dismutase family protein [Oscillospiraceae bacterium]|nr:superoxide dismutase family protein [Oscillospiraceae bacterium]